MSAPTPTVPQEPPPLQRLLERLLRADFDPDVPSLLGAFWLALQPGFNLDEFEQKTETPRSNASTSPKQALPDETPDRALGQASSPRGSSRGSTTEHHPGKSGPEAGATSVYSTPANSDQQTIPASPLRIPGAAALAEKLPLTRAFRPQRKWFRNPRIREIDEEATVEETARSGGLLVPVLNPALERWYELVLVADAGASMDVWHDTLREFEEVLRTSGVFRDVRHVRLRWRTPPNADTAPTPVPRVENAFLTTVNAPTSLPTAKELLKEQAVRLAQTNVRRVILLATTGAAKTWADGSMAELLRIWSRKCSVAIVQMLPTSLWPRLRTGEPSLLLRTMTPGAPASSLQARGLWWSEDPVDTQGKRVTQVTGAIPILPLDAVWIGKWAKMQMGDGQWVPGIVVSNRDEPSPQLGPDPTGEKDWKRLVASFTRASTPDARSLAVYLSSGPFTLPVARLVQAVMLDDRASQTQLAEVLLSGLIERTTPATATLPHEWVEYRFFPEAAAILGQGLRITDKERIADALSRHIERYWGKPVDFHAFVYDPDGLAAIPAWAQPFVRLGSLLSNVPFEREPAEDGRPTAVLCPLAPTLHSLVGEIAKGLERHGFRPLQTDRHRVPTKGVAIVITPEDDSSSFRPEAKALAALTRIVEMGLAGLVVYGPGVQPGTDADNIYYDSHETIAGLIDALAVKLAEKSQAPASLPRDAPQLTANLDISLIPANFLSYKEPSPPLILFSNEKFSAKDVMVQEVWRRELRLLYSSGVRWLRPGDQAPVEPNQLLVCEKFEKAVTIPESCGVVLIDPNLPAMKDIAPNAQFYEGADLDNEALRSALTNLLSERNLPDVFNWRQEPSVRILSILDRMSRAQVWPDIQNSLSNQDQPSTGNIFDREYALRSRVLRSLPSGLLELLGRLAVLREDAPARARASIDPENNLTSFLEGMELVALVDGTQSATPLARYLASELPAWQSWNLSALAVFGVPQPLGWQKSAAEDPYIRENLIFHLQQAGRFADIDDVLLDFQWWALRLQHDGELALDSDLLLLSDHRISDIIRQLMNATSAPSPKQLAEQLLSYPGELPETLLISADRFLQSSTIRPSVRLGVLVVGTGWIDLPPPVAVAATHVGSAIANGGHRLVTGGWPGVDHLVARAFTLALGRESSRLKTDLIQVVEGDQQPDFQGASQVVRVKSNHRSADALRLADVVILIGGAGGTWDAFRSALAANKLVVSLYNTGTDARRAAILLEIFGQNVPSQLLRSEFDTQENAQIAARSLEDLFSHLGSDAGKYLDNHRLLWMTETILPLTGSYLRKSTGYDRDAQRLFQEFSARVFSSVSQFEAFLTAFLAEPDPVWRCTAYLAIEAKTPKAFIRPLIDNGMKELALGLDERETRPLWRWLSAIRRLLVRHPGAFPTNFAGILQHPLRAIQSRPDVDPGGECKRAISEILQQLQANARPRKSTKRK